MTTPTPITFGNNGDLVYYTGGTLGAGSKALVTETIANYTVSGASGKNAADSAMVSALIAYLQATNNDVNVEAQKLAAQSSVLDRLTGGLNTVVSDGNTTAVDTNTIALFASYGVTLPTTVMSSAQFQETVADIQGVMSNFSSLNQQDMVYLQQSLQTQTAIVTAATNAANTVGQEESAVVHNL